MPTGAPLAPALADLSPAWPLKRSGLQPPAPVTPLARSSQRWSVSNAGEGTALVRPAVLRRQAVCPQLSFRLAPLPLRAPAPSSLDCTNSDLGPKPRGLLMDGWEGRAIHLPSGPQFHPVCHWNAATLTAPSVSPLMTCPLEQDECLLGAHDCNRRQFCVNTLGSFYCVNHTVSPCASRLYPRVCAGSAWVVSPRCHTCLSLLLPSATTPDTCRGRPLVANLGTTPLPDPALLLH